MAQPSAATVERARQCLANAVPIPGWPLVDLIRAAAFNSQSAFELLQNAIDYLTCKAKANTQFTDEEKAFLRAFYSDLSRGGEWYMGFPEAAALMWHYIGNSGSRFQINEAVYQTSVIVRDTSEAIKDYRREQIAKKLNFDIVRHTDRTFLSSPQAHRVSQAVGRDYR